MTTELLMVYLAIPVVLLPHGMMFVSLLAGRRPLPTSHDPLVLVVIVGFVLSLLFNIVVAVSLVLLSIPIQYTLSAIFLADAVLIVAWLRYGRGGTGGAHCGYAIWIVVAACFVVMVWNGGLIGILADSWWHMVYANRMAETGSIFLQHHHLTGGEKSIYDFSYEPGWHINLVLIATLVKAPLPLVWHALGAWCSALTLLAYYHFARVLTGHSGIAVLSVILFAVTLGGINAYLRVSPWPGNVAFIVMYVLFAATFTAIDRLKREVSGMTGALLPVTAIYDIVKRAPYSIALCIASALVIASVHLAEGLWYVGALAFYSFVLSVVHHDQVGGVAKDKQVFRYLWLWFFGLWAIAAAIKKPAHTFDLAYVLVTLIVIHGLALGWRRARATHYEYPIKGAVLLCFAGTAWLFVDFPHLWHLFKPEGEIWRSYIPMYINGYFDTWVNLPKWEHQLRAGLLFSGVAGIVGSVWLVRKWPNRAGIFLFATASMALLTLISPYLFTFFASLVKLVGVYRFQVLIFHPIILACCLWLLARGIFQGRDTGAQMLSEPGRRLSGQVERTRRRRTSGAGQSGPTGSTFSSWMFASRPRLPAE